MTRADRIACLVPFCRRTASRARFPTATEIVCGRHWRMCPRRLRRIYSLAAQRWNRQLPSARTWRKHRQLERLWERIKAEILTAAAP